MRFCFVLLLVTTAIAAEANEPPLDDVFQQTVRPFLREFCVDCHRSGRTEGDLDLTADQDLAAVVRNFRHWRVVAERLEASEMPPEDALKQPTGEMRQQVVQWIAAVRSVEAQRTAGDPGEVLARRLSNSEYDHTIDDLTGVDIRPTKTFPIDPANEAGFDNSGESLTMSPALVKKYLEAARLVAEHLVLTPTGLNFAPHPVITETDRDKYCVNRIIDFYQRQRVDYADYLLVLWQYQHRESLGFPDWSLAQLAEQQGLSARYTATLWSQLAGEKAPLQDPKQQPSVGPLAALRTWWQEMPNGTSQREQSIASEQCQQIRDWLVAFRVRLVPQVDNLKTPEVHPGSQPLVLWKNRQFVANRRRCAAGVLEMTELDLPSSSAAAKKLVVPAEGPQRERYLQEFDEFCELFPDTFFVTERARVYLDPKKEKERSGRLLSAGFHSQMGYFRDDAPLVDMMLDDTQRRELDQLWLELDFITSAPHRQYAGFIWFDRTDSPFMRDGEFDRFRAEDKDCTSETKVRELAAVYLAKAQRVGGHEIALAAIEQYFDEMSDTFRRLERLRKESQGAQIQALLSFAERAFRRPLSDQQRADMIEFYWRLREGQGLDHEDAIRDCVVYVLMSPHFCYRVDLPAVTDRAGVAERIMPLDDFALASRLSYFLWSSMPDETLLRLAAQRRLHDPVILKQQTSRLLADPRSRRSVIEFAGNWLDFRRFEQHAGVDREKFHQFSDELRQAMFEEPIHFFMDVIQQDRSILDFLYADHTFVNPELARHYGAPSEWQVGSPSHWRRWERASSHGRGGLLPMAVFLTNNSPGLRTSPVKRGNWLVQRVLGESIPAPPPAVPELPEDESTLGERSLREVLARHRADAACAGCHEKIDSFGLVFEGYDPIGQMRTKDLGGRLIDDTAEFPDHSHGQGVRGLRKYIRQQRENDFVENLCRQLLAFALGRTLTLADESTLTEMQTQLVANDFRMTSLFDVIVTSPAFRHQRVQLEPTE